jgi:hypothetical protein
MASTLVGCDPFNGTLSIQKATKVFAKARRGRLQTVTLQPASYSASLDFKSKTRAELIVRGMNNKIKIPLNIPKGTILPRRNGTINLPSRSTGQPFDLKGKISTQVGETEIYYDSESCVYYISERVCRRRQDRDGRTRRVCQNENIQYRGYRDVAYYNRTTTKRLNLKLYSAGRSRSRGKFLGQNTKREKIYTNRGRCY